MGILDGFFILTIFGAATTLFNFCFAVKIHKKKSVNPELTTCRNIFLMLSGMSVLVASLSLCIYVNGIDSIKNYNAFTSSIYMEKSNGNNLYYSDLGEGKKHLKSNETINDDQKIKIILYERDNLFKNKNAGKYFGEIEVVGSD